MFTMKSLRVFVVSSAAMLASASVASALPVASFSSDGIYDLQSPLDGPTPGLSATIASESGFLGELFFFDFDAELPFEISVNLSVTPFGAPGAIDLIADTLVTPAISINDAIFGALELLAIAPLVLADVSNLGEADAELVLGQIGQEIITGFETGDPFRAPVPISTSAGVIGTASAEFENPLLTGNSISADSYTLALAIFTDPGFPPPFDSFDESGAFSLSIDVTTVPVPASLPLILAGIGVFGFLRRRKAAEVA